MTREEEIKQAAENNLDVSAYLPQDGKMLKETFYIGAEWADKHPKSPWISIKDDLPCNHEELINPKDSTETILVFANIGGIIGITKMVKNSHTSEWIWATRVTVYHWIPIPNLPKRIG